MYDKFRMGDRVRVHLYNRQGLLIKTVEGVVSDFAPETEVAPGQKKDLVWVTRIEGYERPNDVGEMQEADEGWFAITDVEKIEEETENRLPFRVFSN